MLYRLGWICAQLELDQEGITYYGRSLAFYKELKDIPAMAAVLRNLLFILISKRRSILDCDKEKQYHREYAALPPTKEVSWQLEMDKEAVLKAIQQNARIFQYLGLKLSSDDDIIQVASFFGKAKWWKFFGKVVVEPLLPSDIDIIFARLCPFFPGQLVGETHFLTLIPEHMTLKELESLAQNPKQGNKIEFRYKESDAWTQHSTTYSGKAHWVLMTNNVIPDSCKKCWQDQKNLAVELEGQGYELVSVSDAETCLFLEYVQTGNRFYKNSWTRCREQVSTGYFPTGEVTWDSFESPLAIGGFAPDGADVRSYNVYGNAYVGIAVARKFF